MKKSEIYKTILNSLKDLTYSEISMILKDVDDIAQQSKIVELNPNLIDRIVTSYATREIQQPQ